MMTSHTDDLHFAAYLLATRRLQFSGCSPSGLGNRVLFNFEDDDEKLASLYEQYLAGAQAPAIDFVDALRRLRRVMDGKAFLNTRNGAQEKEHANSNS